MTRTRTYTYTVSQAVVQILSQSRTRCAFAVSNNSGNDIRYDFIPGVDTSHGVLLPSKTLDAYYQKFGDYCLGPVWAISTAGNNEVCVTETIEDEGSYAD